MTEGSPIVSDRTPQSADPIDEAVRLHDEAVSARERGSRDEAEVLATQALDILESNAGPDHPDVANVLLCLAGVHEDRAEYSAAEPRYRRAVRILNQAAEETSDRDVQRLRMQAIGGLAGVCRALGRYGEAEPLLKQAIAIAKRTFGDDDAEVAGAMNDLGVLYK
jgi:tetratricopeptide (TPR) repeat protein